MTNQITTPEQEAREVDIRNARVHFYCETLPDHYNGASGVTPVDYIRFLEELTGQDVYKCIQLFENFRHHIQQGAKHDDKEYRKGMIKDVHIVERSQGGGRIDMVGMQNGYRHIVKSEMVTRTILFRLSYGARYSLAKVTCRTDRNACEWQEYERDEWLEKAFLAIHNYKHSKKS